MKFKWVNFFLLYIIVPVVIIPAICMWTGSWFGLFGILLFYIGIAISRFKQWIFLPVPCVFAMWYWYTYQPPAVNDYVTIYLFCLLCGVFFNEISKQAYDFFFKTLPEQMSNVEFDAKVEELNRRLDEFRAEHPGEKVTHEIVEKIRTEIFFR